MKYINQGQESFCKKTINKIKDIIEALYKANDMIISSIPKYIGFLVILYVPVITKVLVL